MKQVMKMPVGLWLFLLGIHTVYFVIAYFFGNIYTVDSYGYLHQASNLWEHHSWYAEDWNAPLLPDYFSFRPPLYASFIICCKLFFQSNYVLLIIQNIISIANLLLLYKILLHCGFKANHVSRVLIAALIFYPAQFVHANLVMTEIIFQGILLLLFYRTLIFAQACTIKNVWWICLLLAVALLTKPVIILFSAALGLLVLYQAYQNKRWQLLYPFLIVALTFHLICMQNQHSTGYYHFSSVKPVFHLKYNAKYTLLAQSGEHIADSTISSVMTNVSAQKEYAARYKMMQQQGNQIILQYPFQYLKIFVKGCIAFFVDPGRYDLFHLFGINDTGFSGLYHEMNVNGLSALTKFMKHAPVGLLFLLILNLCWNMLVTVSFVWFLFYRKAPVFIRLMVFVFVAYIALATGVLGLSRYRVPVYPELCVALMYAYSYLFIKESNAE